MCLAVFTKSRYRKENIEVERHSENSVSNYK